MQFRLMTAVSTLALFGALGSAQATTVAPFDPSCPGLSNSGDRTSVVLSQVTAGSPDNSYEFKICNTSGGSELQSQFVLRDWELPYDPQAGITNLHAPLGWGVAIETIGQDNPNTGWDGNAPTWLDPNDDFFDARYLGLNQVIHFYTCAASPRTESNTCYGSDVSDDMSGPLLFAGQGLAGFGFSSPFGETNAPYQASWVEIPPRSGDPAFPGAGGPNSPGLRNLVPEPSGLALFALGLGAAMAARARRQGHKAD